VAAVVTDPSTDDLGGFPAHGRSPADASSSHTTRSAISSGNVCALEVAKPSAGGHTSLISAPPSAAPLSEAPLSEAPLLATGPLTSCNANRP